MNIHFDEDFIQAVKDNNPLFYELQNYTNLKKTGKYQKGLCPLPNHDDSKSPSLTYYEEDDSAHCFGCNTNINDSLDLLMMVENMDFQDAVIKLAKQANMELPDKQTDEKYKKIRKFRNSLIKLNRLFYQNLMGNSKYSFALDYLKDRGLTKELIDTFRLGYCNGDFTTNKQIKKFTNRIIFPVYDERDNICGFSGRRLPNSNKEYAKYFNSSEETNPLFKKRKLIYGLNVAKQSIREKDYVVWCEGYMDVILLNKVGITNSVASMGTAITEDQIKTIKKYTDNICFFVDADDSGIKAMIGSLKNFRKHNMTIKIIKGKDGQDPADMANDFFNRGKSLEKWIVKNAKTPIEFISDKHLNHYNIVVNNLKRKIIKNISNDIDSSLLDNINTDVALGRLAKEMDLSIGLLKEQIRGG